MVAGAAVAGRTIPVIESLPPPVAPLANLAALFLALAFRRNRAVLLLLVSTSIAAALAGYPEGVAARSDAVTMFAPWLLLSIAASPERGLLARRNLALLSVLAIAIWLTLGAPAHVWSTLHHALPLGALPWSAGAIAGVMTVLAAVLCGLRWLLRGAPMEAGLAFVLACVAVAISPLAHGAASVELTVAGVAAVLAVLYASFRMAFIDTLSGLPNRRALDEALARLSGDYAVAMVDIDHFKRFNDTHGHAAGDIVLKAVAAQIGAIRGGRAFRFGGEEFCVLFGANARASEACEAARQRVEQGRVRIRSAPNPRRRTQAVRRNEASDVRVTVSIGLAARNAVERTPEEVLKSADKALYRAKANGRNCVVAG
jgi:diguanylate cyclase (GGDEF)-like protein